MRENLLKDLLFSILKLIIFDMFLCNYQALKANAEATDLLQTMKMAKERTERDLERLQNKEDSSDSLRRRLRETEVHTHTVHLHTDLHTYILSCPFFLLFCV